MSFGLCVCIIMFMDNMPIEESILSSNTIFYWMQLCVRSIHTIKPRWKNYFSEAKLQRNSRSWYLKYYWFKFLLIIFSVRSLLLNNSIWMHEHTHNVICGYAPIVVLYLCIINLLLIYHKRNHKLDQRTS